MTASSKMPTRHGDFQLYSFRSDNDPALPEPHLALVTGLSTRVVPLVRVHSECITGDVFGSLRCDCGNQLDAALSMIAARGAGLLIYLRQEGRGIGIENKLKAYQLQESGLDTAEANEALGLPVDARDYQAAAWLLKYWKIHRCQLLTNNPGKMIALENQGITIDRVVTLQMPGQHHFCETYLETKRLKFGHLIERTKKQAG